MTDATARFSTLYMIGHAHLDPVWLWRWTEGYQEARATLRAAIALLEEFPDYVFTFEQIAVVEWVRESEPALFARMRELVAEGRIALVGGWWVEPDCNLPSLESFIRQGLVGQRYLLEHFGGIANVGFNADPFGHSATLPQLLKGQRIDGYCFLRPGPHENDGLHTLFEWRGLGGAAVTAYRIPHEYCSNAEDVDAHMEAAVSKISPSLEGEAMVFYGVGNHGGGPTRRNLGSIERLNREGRFGRLVMAGPDRFLAAHRDSARKAPRIEGELQRHAAGCYAAHAALKQLNIKTEAAVIEAERYATLATIAGWSPYPAETMDEAWKTLLFNQFHDILPGSSILPACEDAVHALGGVIASAGRVTNRALQIAASRIAIDLDEETQPVVIFNPHPFASEFVAELELSFLDGDWSVEDADGNPVAWQAIRADATVQERNIFRGRRRERIAFHADVPALGHAVYRVRRVGAAYQPVAARTVRANGATIENEHLRVTIDPQTGYLSEFRTLSDGRDFAPSANAVHTVVSDDASDTWGHRVETYSGPGERFAVEAVRIEDDGPLRASIRVISRYGQSRLSELYILEAGSASLEIRIELDWHEKLKLLKLRYPSCIASETALYQLQYGAIARPADGLEYPGQRWVSVAGSAGERLTVINNAKYAYDCTKGDIGITAARSPVYAWHDPRELRDDETYHYHDQGLQRFSVRLLPQAGDDMSEASRLAEMMVLAPRVVMESFHDGADPVRRARIAGMEASPGLRLTALKPHEDAPSALVLRFVNDRAEPLAANLTLGFLGDLKLEFTLEGHALRSFVVDVDGRIGEVDLLEFEADRAIVAVSAGV